ncbi:MAG: hypothetical protein BM564_06670 [Bacteroidetes bacterium MedPE-SWsnd-G2]|nr:MAG: hypothetical protein BM564_06670 [Bacteroidetes bacterium MedPE-SWsnd-G2]
MGLHKILTYVAMALAVVGVILAIMIIGDNTEQIGSILYVAYIVLAIVLLMVLFFSLKNTFSNKETLKSTLTGVGAFGLLFLVCYYGLASGQETVLKDGEVLTEGESQLVGAGLYMFYALAIIASGTMLFSGIKKSISK